MQATIFNTVKFNGSKLRNRIRTWKVPAVFRNKFVFTGFVFVIWMAFFDQNNLLVQTERLRALHEAESKAEYYLEEQKLPANNSTNCSPMSKRSKNLHVRSTT